MNMEPLNDIALRHGTDKSTNYHCYTPKYDNHFDHIRGQDVRVLELGIWRGASLNTWAEYFGPKSKIYGVDIDLGASQGTKFADNVFRYALDVSNESSLLEFANEYGPFDVIVDDCSHINSHMIGCFTALFPLLVPGGIYVVEDLHACYWDSALGGMWVDQTTPLFTDTIKNLIDSCVGRGKFANAGAWVDKSKRVASEDGVYPKYGEPMWYEENIESIHTYKSMCFFHRSDYDE